MTIPLHSRRTAKPCQFRTSLRSSSPAVHSLLSPTSRIRLSVFSETCALFHFLDHSYPASFPQFAHSSPKNRGYTPTWSYHASSLLEGPTRRSFSEGGPSPLFPCIRTRASYLFCFPYIRRNGGSVSHPKMSARRHS